MTENTVVSLNTPQGLLTELIRHQGISTGDMMPALEVSKDAKGLSANSSIRDGSFLNGADNNTY